MVKEPHLAPQNVDLDENDNAAATTPTSSSTVDGQPGVRVQDVDPNARSGSSSRRREGRPRPTEEVLAEAVQA